MDRVEKQRVNILLFGFFFLCGFSWSLKQDGWGKEISIVTKLPKSF